MAKRFFISYAHGNEDDERLARWLYDQLTAANHTAFLDERLKLGAKWKEEIPRAITECDVFIVLVSDKSNHSDAVHEEAFLARERRREFGLPAIAPIRVKFQSELSYVLGMYLRSFQWRDWRNKADDSPLLEQLLELAVNSNGEKSSSRSSRAARLANLNSFKRPDAKMVSNHPMYFERAADLEARTSLNRDGETIVLLGTRKTGKSSLLNRLSAQAKERGTPFALVDLANVASATLATLPGLLHELAEAFLDAFDLPTDIDPIKTPRDLTRNLERRLIKPVGGRVVLALDEVDRVFDQSYRNDFFGMIRAWHNRRADVDSAWAHVDLLLSISTEPHMLIDNNSQSPFNVSQPIRLKWFDLPQSELLNERYGQPLTRDGVARLHEFTGGHPFLTHLSLYELSRSNHLRLIHLLRDATAYDSPFAGHLNTLRSHIGERDGLLDGFRQVVRFGTVPNEDIAYRLQAAGLVVREQKRIAPSNELYARFFGST